MIWYTEAKNMGYVLAYEINVALIKQDNEKVKEKKKTEMRYREHTTGE